MNRLRTIALFGAALLLGGCAYAPGMWMGKSSPQPEPAAETEAITPLAIDWPLIREFDAQARSAAPVVPQAEPAAYRIGPNDALRITVWNHPDLNFAPNLSVTTRSAADGSSGQATKRGAAGVVEPRRHGLLPMAGQVQAAGRTAPELREQIARRLAQFIKDPQVELEIASFRSQRVFVVGEVKAPGNLAITDVPMRIADAIGQAGGTTPMRTSRP